MLSTKAWMAASSAMVGLILAAATPAAATEADDNETRQEKVRICVGYTSEVDARVFSKKTMEAEVNAIWWRYGVRLEGLTSPCSGQTTGPKLHVRVRRRPRGTDITPQNALGAIYFVQGKPRPLIDLWVDEAVRVIGASPASIFNGASDARSRVELARLLGRSLAHELGHYLLETGEHSKVGLMRAQYGLYDVRTASPLIYSLDDDQLVAVSRTLKSWRVDPETLTTMTDTRSMARVSTAPVGLQSQPVAVSSSRMH
jgi:hypothetical protein